MTIPTIRSLDTGTCGWNISCCLTYSRPPACPSVWYYSTWNLYLLNPRKFRKSKYNSKNWNRHQQMPASGKNILFQTICQCFVQLWCFFLRFFFLFRGCFVFSELMDCRIFWRAHSWKRSRVYQWSWLARSQHKCCWCVCKVQYIAMVCLGKSERVVVGGFF